MSNLQLRDDGLVVATGNAGKVREFRYFLSGFGLKVFPQPGGFEVEEIGGSFAENARLKSLEAASVTGKFALADDSGLSISALGGAPGIFSARYAADDLGRISRVLRELDGLSDRRAYFCAALCISSPEGILFEVEGRCEGVITKSPRGTEGFGYDPIFEVLGTGLTFAEMTLDMKRELGHRGKAFALLKPKIQKII